MKFQPGNSGRPKGSRNALDGFAYACVLAYVQHDCKQPAPAEFAHSNLWKTLDFERQRHPSEYLRRVTSMLPKQVSFEHTTMKEMSENELDDIIAAMRERLLEARQEQALASPLKLVPHVQ